MFSITKICWTFFLAQLIYLHLAQAQLREWTNEQGQKIQAEFISVQADKVQLKLENGLDTLYPINNLSKDDQSYIKSLLSSSLDSNKKTTENPNNNAVLDWSRAWPKEATINPEHNNIQLVSEDFMEGVYVYETTHFAFLSDVKLSISALRNFSRIFEATYAYASSIPFFHEVDVLTANKIPIEVYNFKADYLKNGGPEGSAGVYIRSNDSAHIKVCFDYLGVKRVGSKISFDYQGNSSTLPHEIAHALTDRAYFHPHMKWFTEGIAEYISETEYANSIGSYRISETKMKRLMVPAITAYGYDGKGGKNLGKTITIPSLVKFMTQETFFSSTDSRLTRRNYAVGWLLVYYFIHEHGNGDQFALRQFLKAVKEETQNIRNNSITIESLIREHLMAEQTEEEFNEDFEKAMKRIGIKIQYN